MEFIKQLREMTGAGMVDCKKALDETKNDLKKAVEILRKKGIAKASKRLSREANEGLVKIAVNDDKTEAYILELNSETDFVARNDKFISLANDLLSLIINKKPKDLEELLGLDFQDFKVHEVLANLSGTIGENLSIKRFAIVSGASVAAYSHLGGHLGVIVALDQSDKESLASELALQVAASNPKYLLSSDVDQKEVSKEKEIYKEQLLKAGKPENIIEKIISGKMAKYYSEICLVEQEYIKDEDKKVKDILGDINILKFIRYSL
jgi:elongation factor Ts